MATQRVTAGASDKERGDALAQMHLVKILRAYLLQMVDDTPGYKALLLDRDTMRVTSTQFGRTELAEHNVVHIERLDSQDGKEHVELKARRCQPLPRSCTPCCCCCCCHHATASIAAAPPVPYTHLTLPTNRRL